MKDASGCTVGAHIAGLDGLRALAVALVVIDHATNRFPGGGVGVAVFFVLSGYLITSLLIRERDWSDRIHLGMFYARRALRLWPALLVMLAVCVILGAEPSAAAISALYLTDIVSIVGRAVTPFGHTWSLGVEEQFYLVWPLLLIFIGARRKVALVALAFATLGSIVGCALWTAYSLEATGEVGLGIFNPAWQAHGLLFGCVLALAGGSLRLAKADAWAGIAGLAVVGIAVGATITVQLHAALWWNVVAELVAVVAIVALRSEGGGPFVWRPVVWLGERSYAVYLWHMPLIILIAARGVPLAAGVAVLLSLLAVERSARYVEAPFLRMKSRLHPVRGISAREGVPGPQAGTVVAD